MYLMVLSSVIFCPCLSTTWNTASSCNTWYDSSWTIWVATTYSGTEGVVYLTIHEPSTIRGDVRFEDVEVQITQDLQHLQQNAILVRAVNLHFKGKTKMTWDGSYLHQGAVITGTLLLCNLPLELKRSEMLLTFTNVQSVHVVLSMQTLQSHHCL